MTANILTFNSSKTEFLIGLKQQLSKIHDSSLTTTHCARNLGFIFDEHLTFSDQISALSKFCYYDVRVFDVSAHISTSTIATSILLSKLDYVSLCITTFQTINLNDSNRSMTLVGRAVVKAPINPSLPFSNLSTCLRSTNALNINFFLLPTKFLQPVNLAIWTIWSQFNPLAALAPHLLSPFLAHQPT